MLPHNHNLNLAQGVVDIIGYTEDDVLFSVFPLFHANAKYMTVLAAMVSGARAVINKRFSASRFWDICRREGVTAFNGQGEMLRILLKQPESDADRENSVRVVVGAAAATDLIEQFEQRFDLAVLDAYGMTETGPTIAVSWDKRRPGSAGLPTPWYEARVVDEDDVEVPPGVTGEIVVRPKRPFVMMERYWGNDAATLGSMRNLWFHTGDNAYRDEDGFFWFVARGTDSIRRRGENVSAWEVERVLADHPELLEAAVYGVPSELGGQEVMVAVVRRPESEHHGGGAARLLHRQDAALRRAALRPLHGRAPALARAARAQAGAEGGRRRGSGRLGPRGRRLRGPAMSETISATSSAAERQGDFSSESTMRAVQLVAWQQPAEVREVPKPAPGPGEVLLRVRAAGLCHSDLHLMHWPAGTVPYELPFTLGHEVAGTVAALGDGADGIDVGESVLVYGPWGCGRCPRCSLGEEHLCERRDLRRGTGCGLGRDGGLAEYVVLPSPRLAVPIGDLDPVAAAPLADAGLTPYHAVKRALRDLRPGSTAVVIGVGGLGHVAVQLLRALSGCRIVAVDRREDALDVALDAGADVGAAGRRA